MFRACFDESPVAQAIMESSGAFVRVNNAFQRVFGKAIGTDYRFAGLVNDSNLQMTPTPDLNTVWELGRSEYFMIELADSGKQFSCRIIPRQDLEVIILMVDEVDNANYYQNALMDSLSRLNSLLDCATVFIYRVGMDGKYSYGNKSFLRHFGYTMETLSLEEAIETVHPEDAHELVAAGQQVMMNPKEKSRCRIRKPNASRSRYYATAWEFTAITNGVGHVTEIQCVGTDITEEVANEEKVAAYIKQLRQYNFDISHELRRPLTNLMGLMNLYNQIPLEGAEKEEILQMLNVSLQEMDNITRRITSNIAVDQDMITAGLKLVPATA